MSFSNNSPKTDEQLEILISKRFSPKYLLVLSLICVTVFYFVSFTFSLFVVVTYFLSFHSIEYSIRERRFLKDYATSRGLYYKGAPENISLTGRLFTPDRMGYALTGKYNNFPVMLFYYNHVVGQGKNSTVRPLTVYEVTCTGLSFPYILLQNKKTDRYQTIDMFGEDKDVEVPLEEATNFSLFTTNNYELEALQICTPDFLKVLLDSGLNVSLEFASDKLYIYINEKLTNMKFPKK